MLFSPSLLLIFYIFLSSISIIKASLEDYDKYYKYRTIDEILYTIRAFEDYLFEKKIPIERNIHIFYQERIHLIGYIRNTIIIQYPLFEDINLFLSIFHSPSIQLVKKYYLAVLKTKKGDFWFDGLPIARNTKGSKIIKAILLED